MSGNGSKRSRRRIRNPATNSKFKEDGQIESQKTPLKQQMQLNNKQSSTAYGTKFMEFRKTFQNFNANSNKALNVFQQNGPYSGIANNNSALQGISNGASALG